MRDTIFTTLKIDKPAQKTGKRQKYLRAFMRKFVIFFLAFYAGASYANWQLVDRNSEYELFINSQSLTKTSQGFRLIWLYSYYKENRAGTRRTGYYTYQSFGFDEEVNCVTKESRLYSSFPFSGPMGRGLIRTNNMNAKWMSIYDKNKGSGIKTIFEKLCR